MTVAFDGALIVPPTFATLPSTTRRSPRSTIPADPIVQIVAFLTRTGPDGGGVGAGRVGAGDAGAESLPWDLGRSLLPRRASAGAALIARPRASPSAYADGDDQGREARGSARSS
jgi:hypothetical protein